MSPVAHENLNEGFNQQYKQWIQANFAVLYANGKEELEREGLWVITETYSTQACMIQTWTSKSQEVKLDIRANAMMAGEFGPSFKTKKDSNGMAVNFHAHEDYDSGKRLIVFCDGLRYRFKRWKYVKYEVSNPRYTGSATSNILRSPIWPEQWTGRHTGAILLFIGGAEPTVSSKVAQTFVNVLHPSSKTHLR